MNLTIFLTMAGVILILLALAYFHDKNNSANGLVFVKIGGWALFFVVMMSFMTSGIEYKDGTTEITDGNETTITNNYTIYTNFILALTLSIIAGFGFISSFFDIGRGEE